MNPHEFLKCVARALEETARHGLTADEHFDLVAGQVALNLNGQGVGLTAIAEGSRLTVRRADNALGLAIDFQRRDRTAKPAPKAGHSWPPQ